MRDIVITRKRIRIEGWWLLACLAAALVFNVYAIIRYRTAWTEIFTSLHVTLILALVFYVLLLFVRGLTTLIIRFSTGKGKT